LSFLCFSYISKIYSFSENNLLSNELWTHGLFNVFAQTNLSSCQYGVCTQRNMRITMTCTANWNCDINSCLSCCQYKRSYDCNEYRRNPPKCMPNWNKTNV